VETPRCGFVHPDRSASTDFDGDLRVCRRFKTGFCELGSSCSFAHARDARDQVIQRFAPAPREPEPGPK
jgi:hypothetical protein